MESYIAFYISITLFLSPISLNKEDLASKWQHSDSMESQIPTCVTLQVPSAIF